jgi:diadenosine tetraphosphate (Ap4A) HIT family hydrolase
VHDADLSSDAIFNLATQDCAFCTIIGQPPRLYEISSLYVLPDKYPLVPGHTLVISQEHLRCLAELPTTDLAELEATTIRLRHFLEAEYGTAVACMEHGIVGQTVFHAHLHLLPIGLSHLTEEILQHPDVQPVADWTAVREYFRLLGQYFYLAVGGQRYVITSSSSPVMLPLRDLVSESAGLRVGPRGLVKTATSADIDDLVVRWRRAGHEHQGAK